MNRITISLSELPDRPLDAAGYFYSKCVPDIRRDFRGKGDDWLLVVVFEPAGHEHRAWRLAVTQELARELAPMRVNVIASDNRAAIDAAVSYLEAAPGVTGQYLPLDDVGAGPVL